MFKLKKILICLILITELFAMNSLPLIVEGKEIFLLTKSNQQDYTLLWNNVEDGKVLKKVTIGKDDYTYTYNENQNRISKISREGIIIYEYNNESMLISEVRDNIKFEYQYDELNSLVGFTLNNITYKYVKDDDFNVIAITDDKNDCIVKYEYDKNGITSAILGKDDMGKWVDMSKESLFIGTLNYIRLHSYYYDIETGWYYNGYQYYDSINNKYIGGTENLKDISTFEDFLSSSAIVPLTDDLELQILKWRNSLLNSSTFGQAIPYSSGWYNGLSDVAILSRLIYGENTFNSYDQDAVAWILINRKIANKTYFGGNTYRGIAIYPYQFEPITGGSAGTQYARVPNTSNPRWSNAVTLACILLSTSSKSDYEGFIYKPAGISNQLYFVGLNYFFSNFSNGKPISKDATPAGTGITYSCNSGSSYSKINNVVIVFNDGKSFQDPTCKKSITSNTNFDTSGERASHNIFFGY